MREFKKKTIALVLASVVTVAGAFGAERYKNSLMALDFECSPNGAVNMVVQTKNSFIIFYNINNFNTFIY